MRIILYTGKGGVGKTSAAAATACRLAKSGKRVMIMSTDQAHSLSDSFEINIGSSETKIMDNLYALEVDAEKENEKAWGEMQGYIKTLLSAKAKGGIETEELLVFPGLEELFSLFKILDIKESGNYDVLIVDCAPTGETLALLKFPEMFGNFIERFLPMKRKAVKTAGPIVEKVTQIPMPKDSLFDELTVLTERLAKMQEVMSDRENVSIRIVMTPEKIVIREGKRNFTWLSMYNYNVDAIIINRVYPKTALSGYFSRWSELQEQSFREIEESFMSIPIFKLELKRQELKSVDLLLEASNELFKDTDPGKVLAKQRLFELKKENSAYIFKLYIPFTDKQDIDLVKKGGELILKIENMTRRILLPDLISSKEIESAKYEAGSLELRFVQP